jgi:hypothetical protein
MVRSPTTRRSVTERPPRNRSAEDWSLWRWILSFAVMAAGGCFVLLAGGAFWLAVTGFDLSYAWLPWVGYICAGVIVLSMLIGVVCWKLLHDSPVRQWDPETGTYKPVADEGVAEG